MSATAEEEEDSNGTAPICYSAKVNGGRPWPPDEHCWPYGPHHPTFRLKNRVTMTHAATPPENVTWPPPLATRLLNADPKKGVKLWTGNGKKLF